MNRLSNTDRTRVIACLVEGNSIRSTVRITGIAKKTVSRLGVELGQACERFANKVFVDLPCKFHFAENFMREKFQSSPLPAEDTASTSFTLPRPLMDALESKAESEMTNKSDIIRRALMNYLTPEEQDAVRSEMKPKRSAAYQEHRPSPVELNDKASKLKPTIRDAKGLPLSSELTASLKAVGKAATSLGGHEDPESPPSPSTDEPTAPKRARGHDTAKRSKSRPKAPAPAPK